MADREIKITFPEKKMEALVFFLGEQNEKIEEVLTAHLDKTYEKYSPSRSGSLWTARSPQSRRKCLYECPEHRVRQENWRDRAEKCQTGYEAECFQRRGTKHTK